MDKEKMRIRKKILRKMRLFSYTMLVPAFVLMMAGCGGFVDGPEGTALDTQAPTVILPTFPADNETGVLLDSTISVTFSEPMATNTINNTSFLVEQKPPTATVSGVFSFSADDKTVTFTPNDPPGLSSLSDYTVTLLPNIADAAGNALVVDPIDLEFKWKFTTGP